jgi:1-acyl-sn-glycerol-3-phosphate acyltransferase
MDTSVGKKTLNASYRVPFVSRLFRWLFRPIFRRLFYILFRVEVEGLEHVPAQGPYLVAINHVSLYEPPLILAFWPRPLEAVGAVDIWHRRGQSILAHLYGGIQVHRGQFDRQVIEKMIAAIKAGFPLLIAPEGGRTHTLNMRQGLPGAAYIVHKMNLPVIPVGIMGTSDDLFERLFESRRQHHPPPTLRMRIGEPIHLPAISSHGEARRQALQSNIDLVMAHIGRLLPVQYHGVYAEQIAQLEFNYSQAKRNL